MKQLELLSPAEFLELESSLVKRLEGGGELSCRRLVESTKRPIYLFDDRQGEAAEFGDFLDLQVLAGYTDARTVLFTQEATELRSRIGLDWDTDDWTCFENSRESALRFFEFGSDTGAISDAETRTIAVGPWAVYAEVKGVPDWRDWEVAELVDEDEEERCLLDGQGDCCHVHFAMHWNSNCVAEVTSFGSARNIPGWQRQEASRINRHAADAFLEILGATNDMRRSLVRAFGDLIDSSVRSQLLPYNYPRDAVRDPSSGGSIGRSKDFAKSHVVIRDWQLLTLARANLTRTSSLGWSELAPDGRRLSSIDLIVDVYRRGELVAARAATKSLPIHEYNLVARQSIEWDSVTLPSELARTLAGDLFPRAIEAAELRRTFWLGQFSG